MIYYTRRKELHYPGIPVVLPTEEVKGVDAVIVTAVAEFDNIYDILKCKVDCPIISIEEVISESM